VVIIEWMRQQGLWEEATDRLRIQREGGYAGIDAFVFLTHYFASGLDTGIKEFSELAREHHKQLAAVGERKRLPTQASMSRILAAVEAERVQEFGSWLLRDAPGVLDVLQHPSVLTRDAVGEGWHVFDWDPTVTTLRHRALPVFDGTPAARRRSESLAEPGYPGRKRGDVQFSRATLQHAGSGLWLGIEMAPGNGALRDAFHSAIQQVIATCEDAEVQRDRAILRADGAAGNVPFITACVEAGVPYITRLAHYQLLEDQSVVQHLNEAAWFDVPSSGSGPKRQAADLGRVVLEPAQSTLQADGSPYEPIEARVVVSRFPCPENGRGAGVVVDGWQYELYGTDLSPESWPEVEVVAGYYGRIGQENRFFQEDRELGLDRIFSYHLPGQQLATLVGLFIWNFYICRGMDLARPSEDLPEQQVAQNTPVAETPQLARSHPTEPAAPQDVVADCTRADNAEPSTAATPAPSSDAERSSLASGSDTPVTTRHDVIQALDAADWERVLDKHDGWMWLAHKGGLQCPAKALLPLVRVEQVKGQSIRARFQADWGTCDSCEFRRSCTRSDDPHYRKDVRLPIPSPYAESIRAMWLSMASAQRASMSASKRRLRRPGSPRRSSRPIWRIKPLSWQPPDLPSTRPQLAVAPPTLLPAELRKISRGATRRIEAHVLVDLPSAQRKLSPVLAYSAAERQKRRLSWEERLRWNELPEATRVEIRLLGAGAVQHLLAPTTDCASGFAKSA